MAYSPRSILLAFADVSRQAELRNWKVLPSAAGGRVISDFRFWDRWCLIPQSAFCNPHSNGTDRTLGGFPSCGRRVHPFCLQVTRPPIGLFSLYVYGAQAWKKSVDKLRITLALSRTSSVWVSPRVLNCSFCEAARSKGDREAAKKAPSRGGTGDSQRAHPGTLSLLFSPPRDCRRASRIMGIAFRCKWQSGGVLV